MKNIQNARCSLEKLLNEECDQTTYYQNIGRLEIDNFDEHAIDLTKKTMYSFENGETICFYHEKIYHTRYEALQTYCFALYQLHKKISERVYIPDLVITETLIMKPVKNVIFIKVN